MAKRPCLRSLPREVDGVHPPFANYSHGVVVPPDQQLLFLSGQLGITAANEVPEGAEGQADVIFASIGRLLAAEGLDARSIVRVNAFVTNRDYLAEYMRSRDRFLESVGVGTVTDASGAASNYLPASTLMVVSGFSRPEFKVEIEVIAAKALAG